MSVTIDLLYEYFVGYPNPKRWPEELHHCPDVAHGHYAFEQGLRLGFLLAVECMGPELLRP